MAAHELPAITHPAHARALAPRRTGLAAGKGRVALVATAAALAATALWVNHRARRAEREHPPLGRFLEVDGVRLHYAERGQGQPVVLLHGNGSMIEDLAISGLIDLLAERYRVIAFDRPGYGYSSRPRDRIWTPDAQADLLLEACRQLVQGSGRACPVAQRGREEQECRPWREDVHAGGRHGAALHPIRYPEPRAEGRAGAAAPRPPHAPATCLAGLDHPAGRGRQGRARDGTPGRGRGQDGPLLATALARWQGEL